MNEINIMQKMDHPYIISFKEYFHDEEENLYWIVMEYLPWKTLSSFFKETKEGLSKKNVKAIISQLLQILCYLSNKNICHRDITAKNILISPNLDEIKLIDFGVSKIMHQMQDYLFSPVGKSKYRAPEFSQYGSYNIQYDIWQTGLIFLSMLQNQRISTKKALKFLEDDRLKFAIDGLEKELLLGMLNPDPTKRISCLQAKTHPWFLEQETIFF